MPDWKPHIRSRLASLRLSSSREHEIIEELSQHLEDRWRELVASGASEDEATKLALAGFRDRNLLARHLAPLRQAHASEPMTPGAPGRRLLSDLWQDLRHAGRTLRKRPTFASAAILTLALGIGSNAAIFTIVNAILLRPLPLPHSEQLQAVYTRFLPSSGLDFPYFELSSPELADIRSRVNAYSGVAGYYLVDRTLSRDKGEAERVSTMQVTSGFFDVLGIGPVRGRTFTEEEARGGACFAILSEDTPAASASIGSTIRLDDVPCEVIGVMPKALASVSAGMNPLGGGRADRITAWTPLLVPEWARNNRGVHLMLGVARLRQGASAALADAQLQALREYWSATVPPTAHQADAAAKRTLETIEDRLAVLPGAESVGGMSALPLASAGPVWGFTIDGRPAPSPGETPRSARYLAVTPGAFQTLRIPVKRGRLLDERDVAEQPFVAVINETAARHYWAADDPIGATIRFNARPRESIRIVGVVGDIRSLGPGEPAPPAVYLSLAQSAPPPAIFGRSIQFVIRTSGTPTDFARSARAAVASVDPELPLVDLRPMTEVASAASGQPRFTTLVMSVFAGVAFFLAALGLYGILAYSVEQRTVEIGVRVALGASRGEVVRLIVGHGMRLTLIGAMVGVLAALMATRLIGGVLPGVRSADPVTYAAVVALLASSAFMASYLPARRATRVDPLVALRSD